VDILPVAGCKKPKPSYQVVVTNLSGGRQLTAVFSSSNAGKKATWTIDAEGYQ